MDGNNAGKPSSIWQNPPQGMRRDAPTRTYYLCMDNISNGLGRLYDVVVVGTGVIGAAIAQKLARQGAKVAVLDRAPGPGGGCSYANAAILAPYHVTPLATPSLLREVPRQMIRRPPAIRIRPQLTLVPWLGSLAGSALTPNGRAAGEYLRRLALESTRMHVQLAEQGLNPELRKTGALEVHIPRGTENQNGMQSPSELHAIEPALAPLCGATRHNDEWTLESQSFVRAMLDDARNHGTETYFRTSALHLLTRKGRIVGIETSIGVVRAKHLVLAAGLGSVPLAEQVGVSLPLRGGRGYVTDFARTELSLPVRVKGHRIVITPLSDRTRVSGVIEFGNEGRPYDLSRTEAMRQVAACAVPALHDATVIDRWAGERPCTPDGLPVIGRSGNIGNLSIATGHGMWGLILAPVTAHLIAQGITNPRSTHETATLTPDRFNGVFQKLFATATSVNERQYEIMSVAPSSRHLK